jgi:hypothetical protein
MIPILADAGVPMLMLAFPAAFYLLVPVVLVETWISRRVTEISPRRRFLGVLSANAVSTLAGWPLAWIAMALLQLFVIPGGGGAYGLSTVSGKIASVTLQAAWLIPYEDDLYWMVPTAAMVLMVPAFFVSILTERLVLRFFWRGVVTGERKSFVWTANLASYALLIGFGLVWLAWLVVQSHRHH